MVSLSTSSSSPNVLPSKVASSSDAHPHKRCQSAGQTQYVDGDNEAFLVKKVGGWQLKCDSQFKQRKPKIYHDKAAGAIVREYTSARKSKATTTTKVLSHNHIYPQTYPQTDAISK